MTAQSENKDKAEQKVSKDELSEKELEKATGGGAKNTTKGATNDAPKETVTFEYGGLQVTYSSQ